MALWPDIKELAGRLLKKFKSVRLAAWVIALLTLIYFLGLVIPQKWMFDTRQQYDLWLEKSFFNRLIDLIGFTDIYLSPLTILLLAVFFVNLVVVSINRVPLIMRRAFIGEEPPRFSAEDIRKGKDAKAIPVRAGAGDVAVRVRRFFKKQRWHLIDVSGADAFLAVKNRISPLGFLLFHLSFLLCLAGALMIMYTRFSGDLVLTEGQSFEDEIRQFRKIERDPKILKALPSLGLYLEDVYAVYEKGVPSELVLETLVRYKNETKRETLKVNEPINRGPLSVIAKDIGVSPLFIIRGPDGREIDGAWVSLNVLQGEQDSFKFDTDERYEFFVKFYPDYYTEGGEDRTRSIEVKHPAVHLTVFKSEERVFKGTIKMGERANIDPFFISFEGIRYWAEFQIVREYGKVPLVAGFILACAGLIMRLVFYQKRMRVAVEAADGKTLLYIDGRSEYFQYSYTMEMEKNIEKLKEALVADVDGTS